MSGFATYEFDLADALLVRLIEFLDRMDCEALTVETAHSGSGFGANDVGRNRDTTNAKPDGFDSMYPISVDIQGNYINPGRQTVAGALSILKAKLTYTLRYEPERSKSRTPHPDLVDTTFDVADGLQTVRQLLASMLESLPKDWQATIFKGHVVLYKESTAYKHGTSFRNS